MRQGFGRCAIAAGLVLLCLASARFLAAQVPSFELSIDAPASIVDDAGDVLQYDAVAKLTTTGLDGVPDAVGAQGWSLSIVLTGGTMISATTDGTVAAKTTDNPPGLWNGGFNKTQVVDPAKNGGQQGAVSAIVLSFTQPVTLPPSGTADVLKLVVEVTVPQPVENGEDLECAPLESTLEYVNGLVGAGQPVENKVTFGGNSFIPTLGRETTTVCPKIVKPLEFKAVVVDPPATTADADAAPITWVMEVPVGTASQAVTAGVALRSNLPEDPAAVEPNLGGAQGWSVSVLTEPCFNIATATTAGTAAAKTTDNPPGYWQGGFNKTQVVDPAKNGGQTGAVSAVVLSFTSGATLPPAGEFLVLALGGTMDGSSIAGPGEQTAPCLIHVAAPSEAGLIGAGQPVKTAVTVGGNTKNPGVRDGLLVLQGARESKFVRGNANNDTKVNIADAIFIINELFRGGPPAVCQDAADANNDGALDSTDAVYLIAYQFTAGPVPPVPFSDCGVDPEGDADGLLCEETQNGCKPRP